MPVIRRWIRAQGGPPGRLLQPGQLDAFAALWQRDLVAIEVALAEFIVNDDYSTRLEAEDAVDLYLHFSGRGSLLFATVRPSTAYLRTLQLLRAIRTPSDALVRDEVLQIACTAARR